MRGLEDSVAEDHVSWEVIEQAWIDAFIECNIPFQSASRPTFQSAFRLHQVCICVDDIIGQLLMFCYPFPRFSQASIRMTRVHFRLAQP